MAADILGESPTIPLQGNELGAQEHEFQLDPKPEISSVTHTVQEPEPHLNEKIPVELTEETPSSLPLSQEPVLTNVTGLGVAAETPTIPSQPVAPLSDEMEDESHTDNPEIAHSSLQMSSDHSLEAPGLSTTPQAAGQPSNTTDEQAHGSVVQAQVPEIGFGWQLAELSATDELSATSSSEHQLPYGVADESHILPAVEDDTPSQFTDDGYSEVSSSTTSITSSILNHKYEHGRRFHAYKAGAYFLPNDDEEQDRMDLQYSACDIFWDQKIYHAPLENPRRILDLGTGTGIWAIEMGDRFPGAEVIGVDLSPIQPKWAPPNVSFQIDDVEEQWTFPLDHFDYIHSRLLLCGSIKSFDLLFQQSFRHLAPGGYLEVQEVQTEIRSDDYEFPEDCALLLWCKLLREAVNLMEGRSLEINGEAIKRQMEAAGFEDVVVKFRKCPIGDWPADAQLRKGGAFQLTAMLLGLHGLTIAAFTRMLHWSEPEIEVLLARTRKEFMNRKAHLWWPSYIVYGRKPYQDSFPSPTSWSLVPSLEEAT